MIKQAVTSLPTPQGLTVKAKNNLPTTSETTPFSEVLRGAITKRVSNIMEAKESEQFIVELVSLVNRNPDLINCDTTSLITCALTAKTLNLSFNPSLGRSYILPFKDNSKNKDGSLKNPSPNGTPRIMATFQIGYKGYIELAARSGIYRTLNVISMKKGEVKTYDPIFENLSYTLINDSDLRNKTETSGYFVFFEYLNGFRKALYWTVSQMKTHALTYSPSYKYDITNNITSSFWSKNFDAMAEKTMLRQLINKWGAMSPEMQAAFEADNDDTIIEGQLPVLSNSPHMTVNVQGVCPDGKIKEQDDCKLCTDKAGCKNAGGVPAC